AVVISVSFWVFSGVAAGIIALFGIRRHGRKGILIPALVGIVFWVVPISLTIFFGIGLPPGAMKRGALPIQFTPLQTDSTAQRISSQDPPFSLDIPKGFLEVSSDEMPPDTRFAFMRSKGDPDAVTAILVEILPGMLAPWQTLAGQPMPEMLKGAFNVKE